MPSNSLPSTASADGLDFRKNPAVLQFIADALVAGIFTVDARGRFVAWNRGAERITGYSSSDLLGQPCTLLEGANCKGFTPLTELMQQSSNAPSGLCQQECKVLSKDGRDVHIHGLSLIHISEPTRPY